MTKWYNKLIEVVTKKNFIAVLLFINSLFFYVIQKISDSKEAKIIGIFSFSMGMGQSIGERLGFKRKKNVVVFPLLFIAIVSFIFQNYIKNGGIVTTILVAISLGEAIGFSIGRVRAKKQID